MAIYSGIFNSVNGDRKYNAWWFAKYFSTFIGNGVFPNPSTGLQVMAGNNMTVVVKPGNGWIDGYFLHSDSDHVLQLDIADGVLKRIDRVVMRLNHLTRQIEIVVKKGTFASSPVAPPLQRDADAWELVLADVFIGNGATQITQANITDQRLNTALCGIVHGTVNQVDTTTLFNQYQSWINQQKTAYELDFVGWSDNKRAEIDGWMTATASDFALWRANFEASANNWMTQEKTDFEAWYQSLQDLLDENTAATLTAKVQDLENNKANSNEVAEHIATDASLTQKGHVQLNSSTSSADETMAATPKAVKDAYDLANEAKTIAENVGGELIIEKFDVPGTYTWTVPEGVTKVYVSGSGGGGGGGHNAYAESGGITSFGSYLSLSGGSGGGGGNRPGLAGGFGGQDGAVGRYYGHGGGTLFGQGGRFKDSAHTDVPVGNGHGYGSGGGGTFYGGNVGNGGGGGECALDKAINVTPGETINITIGKGGDGVMTGFSGRGADGFIMIKYM